MSHLNVTPEDLEATAKVLLQPVTALDDLPAQINAAEVPSGTFGHIPGLAAHLDKTYKDHVDHSTDMVRGACAGLGAAVNSLRATALGMRQLEQNTVDTINQSVPG